MECHSRVFFVAQLFLIECKRMILRPSQALNGCAIWCHIHSFHSFRGNFKKKNSTSCCTSRFLKFENSTWFHWFILVFFFHKISPKNWDPQLQLPPVVQWRPWPPWRRSKIPSDRPRHVPWEKKLPRSWWRCLSHYGFPWDDCTYIYRSMSSQ